VWPSRKNGGGHRAEGKRYSVPLNWSQPLPMGGFYDTIFRPASEAVGRRATRPAMKNEPTRRGLRLHDLRHTFAVLQLSAGVHFMQVSKWLGHSTFTLLWTCTATTSQKKTAARRTTCRSPRVGDASRRGRECRATATADKLATA
jgi:integrase